MPIQDERSLLLMGRDRKAAICSSQESACHEDQEYQSGQYKKDRDVMAPDDLGRLIAEPTAQIGHR